MGKTASLANIGSIADSSLGFRNRIINGGLAVWQRGTSGSATAGYAYQADRWEFGYSGTVTASQQTGETGIAKYALRIQRDAGQTSTSTPPRCGQSIEVLNCADLAGATVTLSFRARCGANYSGASNTLTSRISTGTGTDTSSLRAGFTGQVNSDQNNTLTTSFQTFTQTVTLGGSITQVAVAFIAGCSGTAGANDWFEIENVQLEKGSTATSFDYRPYGTELSLCQRYCFRAVNYDLGRAQDSTYTYYGVVRLPVTMRASASYTASSGTFTVNAGSAGVPGLNFASADTALFNNTSSNWTATAFVQVSATLTAEL